MKRINSVRPTAVRLEDIKQGQVFSWQGLTELAMVTDENTFVWLTGKSAGLVESDAGTGQSPVTRYPTAEIHV